MYIGRRHSWQWCASKSGHVYSRPRRWTRPRIGPRGGQGNVKKTEKGKPDLDIVDRWVGQGVELGRDKVERREQDVVLEDDRARQALRGQVIAREDGRNEAFVRDVGRVYRTVVALVPEIVEDVEYLGAR